MGCFSSTGNGACEHANEHSTLETRIADKLVFSKVRAALGMSNICHRMWVCCITTKTTTFLFRYGRISLKGTALLKTPVIPVNTTAEPGMIRVGYVGKCIDGVEAKIAEDGEILAKGPNI